MKVKKNVRKFNVNIEWTRRTDQKHSEYGVNYLFINIYGLGKPYFILLWIKSDSNNSSNMSISFIILTFKFWELHKESEVLH